MTRTYLLLAALGLTIAACGEQGKADKDATGASGGETTNTETAPIETPDLLTGKAGPDGVVPGGAIDVLQREGWRVAGQAAAAPATSPTP